MKMLNYRLPAWLRLLLAALIAAPALTGVPAWEATRASAAPPAASDDGAQAAARLLAAQDSFTPTTTLYLPVLTRRAPAPTLFGVQANAPINSQAESMMLAAGIRWIRAPYIPWDAVEPTPGARNWSALATQEAQLRLMAGARMTPIVFVSRTPTWARQAANSGSSCGPVAADKLDEFAAFLGDLVARYSRPPYNVKHWEIWNEPDVDPTQVGPDSPFGCWGDKTDAYFGGGHYAAMLKLAHPAIKAADPAAQVLVGGLLLDCDPVTPPAGGDCSSSRFLEGILKNGGGPYFDGISFHAYDYFSGSTGRYLNLNWSSVDNTTGPVVLAKAQFIRSVLSQYGVTGKYLLNTEAALLCPVGPCDGGLQITKAYHVAKVYAAALQLGLRANVWYAWDDDTVSQALVTGGLNPTLAYFAFQFAAREIADAQFVRLITTYPRVTVYELNRGDRRLWLAWSQDETPQTISLPGLPLAAFDSDGTVLTPTVTLDLTAEPFYLEWAP